MNHAETETKTELEELMHALESLERRMTLMQYRVARLKRETRIIRADSESGSESKTPSDQDRVRLRSSAERLKRFATEKPLPPGKRNLH